VEVVLRYREEAVTREVLIREEGIREEVIPEEAIREGLITATPRAAPQATGSRRRVKTSLSRMDRVRCQVLAFMARMRRCRMASSPLMSCYGSHLALAWVSMS
jgi:hypothetical protein